IGHPGVKHEVAAYVLRKPPQSEREQIFKCIDQAKAALPSLLDGDMNKATMTIHAQPQRPKPPRKPPQAPDPNGSTEASS
ncbi:MAG TPA: aminoacyl-tRNA hydrolase, partial [Aquabacterium sp.]|nr:aminoacyl-tRNA hydrolase [Aquabacterium sp.]